MSTAAFETRTFRGGDGTSFSIESFRSSFEGGGMECAKLSRSGFGKNNAAMRLWIDDLGLLAMHAHEAYVEALGRTSMEVSPDQLKAGDAIEGLGEIKSVVPFSGDGKTVLMIVVHIKDTETQVSFMAGGDGSFKQLVDITRPKSV